MWLFQKSMLDSNWKQTFHCWRFFSSQKGISMCNVSQGFWPKCETWHIYIELWTNTSFHGKLELEGRFNFIWIHFSISMSKTRKEILTLWVDLRLCLKSVKLLFCGMVKHPNSGILILSYERLPQIHTKRVFTKNTPEKSRF